MSTTMSAKMSTTMSAMMSATTTLAEVLTTSGAETVRAAGRPDGAAGACLSELFAHHGVAVLGLCRLLLRHPQEAEDAVQATFLSAYRSLLRGTEPRHPAAWLAAIARNECLGRIHRRMREPLTEPEPESTLPDPVAAAAGRADLAELWHAIGELPRQQREALLLREFSGLSYGELATSLAVSEPAVESLLFRARRSLRTRLRPVYGSATAVAPLGVIRDALARAVGGMPDPSTTGLLAKVASVPVVAKLAASTAAIVVAGGTVAAVEHRDAAAPESAAKQPARAAVHTPAGVARVPSVRVSAREDRRPSASAGRQFRSSKLALFSSPARLRVNGAPASAGRDETPSAPALGSPSSPARPATPAPADRPDHAQPSNADPEGTTPDDETEPAPVSPNDESDGSEIGTDDTAETGADTSEDGSGSAQDEAGDSPDEADAPGDGGGSERGGDDGGDSGDGGEG